MTSILEQAIQLEEAAEGNYRRASERTTDPGAARILGTLADEEKKHATALRTMKGVSGLVRSRLLKDARAWVRGAVEGGRTTLSPDAGLIDVLRHAMDVEKMTEAFYRNHAATAQPAAVADLFAKLADIEKGHFLLIGSWIEYFSRPDEWVESAEFGVRDDY